MAASKGMVVVRGTTYRIVETTAGYQVVRVLDDRSLGSFRCVSEVETWGVASTDCISAVAREALRLGKLPWREPEAPRTPTSLGTFGHWLHEWDRAVSTFVESVCAPLAFRGAGALSPNHSRAATPRGARIRARW